MSDPYLPARRFVRLTLCVSFVCVAIAIGNGAAAGETARNEASGGAWAYLDGRSGTDRQSRQSEQEAGPVRRIAADDSGEPVPPQAGPGDAMGAESAVGTEAAVAEPAKRYVTRDEQLEAGQQREITDWLYSTTLAEYEWSSERLSDDSDPGAEAETDRSSVLTLQAGLELVPAEDLRAELILEYDSEADEIVVDELVAAAEWEDFELEVGKQGLPFGEYFSRFVSDPLLEFGDTTETAVKLSYGFGDAADVSLTGYEGRAREASGGSDLDYVAAVESEPWERLSLGLSYLTDLADTDERLLRDADDRYTEKVGALSGYALWIGDSYELNFEYVAALDRFNELDPEIDQPFAWNLELGLYLIDDLDLAFRVEGSDELEDAPKTQAGFAATWLFHDSATLTVEFLQGRFRNDFVTDDEDNDFDTVTTVGLLLSVAL